MTSCIYMFKSGKRKNFACGKQVLEDEMCKVHIKLIFKQDEPILINKSSNILNIDTLETLQFKLENLDTTFENKNIITKRFRYIELIPITSVEYQKNINWLRHALNFPYNIIKNSKVGLENTTDEISNYVSDIYKKLDDYIYGLDATKEEVLSFVCKRISNPNSNNHILALEGGNGVGKTRFAHGLADSLGLPIKTINLGCVNDVSYFTGYGFTYVDSEPGRIVQILNEVRCKNCIIYFDELDKIHLTAKSLAINSFLTHLIDYSQNSKFQDVYLSGLELDLSKVFFVFSFNDLELVDKTVLDRLKIVTIPHPSFDDKVHIAKEYIIPEISKNINYSVDLSNKMIQRIVKKASSNDGLRSIRRLLDDIISKLNVIRLLNENSRRNLSYYDEDIDHIIENILESSVVKKQIPNFYI
jgi:ATP-dependent Lon protease